MPALCSISNLDEPFAGLQDVQLPLETTPEDLQALVTSSMPRQDDEGDEVVFAFYVNEMQITKTLGEHIYAQGLTLEHLIQIRAVPQEKITVSALSRCSADLPGHEDAVLCCQFAPDSRFVASGSGDKTIRIWDCNTATCRAILRGHEAWVLALRYSPDGSRLVSADHAGAVFVWNCENWTRLGGQARAAAKKQWVTSVQWDWSGERFFTGAKDGQIRVYDANGGLIKAFGAHSRSVTALAVTGRFLVSASEDCAVRFWRLSDLQIAGETRHAHWVNSVAASQGFLVRFGVRGLARLWGYYGPTVQKFGPTSAAELLALPKAAGVDVLRQVLLQLPELVATASDDHSLQIVSIEEKPVVKATLTGHTRPVAHVIFAPNGELLGSCSFDRTVRLWGASGRFLSKFQAHASEVYQLAFSADSRLVLSGGKDSTCKVYSAKQQRLLRELPGHADAVYCVDWAPSGEYGVSGSKDRMLKLWRQ